MARRFSEASLVRARNYAVREPSFTSAFMAWELDISKSLAFALTEELLRLGIVRQIEPRQGPYAAVYAYSPPKEGSRVSRLFPELDASRVEGAGADAPKRGQVVPHTRHRGESDTPGRTRKRQEKGVRIKRRSTG